MSIFRTSATTSGDSIDKLYLGNKFRINHQRTFPKCVPLEYHLIVPKIHQHPEALSI